jgi:hypothetical protein
MYDAAGRHRCRDATYGGQVLASDTSAYVLEGVARTMNAKRIRRESTANCTMVLVEEFTV